MNWENSHLVLPGQVIAAEGEKKASRALREASETISESPAALQLRYLQVILHEKIQSKSDTHYKLSAGVFAPHPLAYCLINKGLN